MKRNFNGFLLLAVFFCLAAAENAPPPPPAATPTMKQMIETFRELRDRMKKEGKENAARVLEEKIALAQKLDAVISRQLKLNQEKSGILARMRALEPAVTEKDPAAKREMWNLEEALVKVNLALLDARAEAQELLIKLQELSLEEALEKDEGS